MTLHAFHEEDPTLSGLQAAAGDQNAPSPEQGQPPEGALGAPASAGGDSKTHSLGGGQTYFDMWNEASDEDQAATVEEMETSLGSQGTGVIAKTNEIASNAMAEKDGKTLNLLLKWGWKPPEERPAFDPASMGEADPSGKVEGALGGAGKLPVVGPEDGEVAAFSGPTDEAIGPPEGSNDAQEAHAKKIFNRRKMGGFLMELGLNILASNRDDAGGAVGDAFNQTRSARDELRRTRAAEDMAKSERKREMRREDEADTLKQEKADREVAKAARDEAKAERDANKAELDKLHEFELEDGSVAFYEKREGPVTDKAGNKIKLSKKDKDKLGAASKEASYRDLRRAIGVELGNIEEEMPDELYLNGEPTWDERLALAKERVKGQMKTARALYNGDDVDDIELAEDDIKDYNELSY